MKDGGNDVNIEHRTVNIEHRTKDSLRCRTTEDPDDPVRRWPHSGGRNKARPTPNTDANGVCIQPKALFHYYPALGAKNTLTCRKIPCTISEVGNSPAGDAGNTLKLKGIQ